VGRQQEEAVTGNGPGERKPWWRREPPWWTRAAALWVIAAFTVWGVLDHQSLSYDEGATHSLVI
jgi:hypothetical protein